MVHDASRMCCIQSIGNSHTETEKRVYFHPPTGDTLLHGLALQKFHGDEATGIVLAVHRPCRCTDDSMRQQRALRGEILRGLACRRKPHQEETSARRPGPAWCPRHGKPLPSRHRPALRRFGSEKCSARRGDREPPLGQHLMFRPKSSRRRAISGSNHPVAYRITFCLASPLRPESQGSRKSSSQLATDTRHVASSTFCEFCAHLGQNIGDRRHIFFGNILEIFQILGVDIIHIA